MFKVEEKEDGTFWVVDSAGVPINTNLHFQAEAFEKAVEHNLRMKGLMVCYHCPAVIDINDKKCDFCEGEQ